LKTVGRSLKRGGSGGYNKEKKSLDSLERGIGDTCFSLMKRLDQFGDNMDSQEKEGPSKGTLKKDLGLGGSKQVVVSRQVGCVRVRTKKTQEKNPGGNERKSRGTKKT